MHPAATSSLDITHIEAIATGMPDAILNILSDFQKNFGTELKSLTTSLGEVSQEKWIEFFHRIKGTGGTLGLAKLHQLSQSLELQTKEGYLPQKEALDEFLSLFEDSCQQATVYLKSLPK